MNGLLQKRDFIFCLADSCDARIYRMYYRMDSLRGLRLRGHRDLDCHVVFYFFLTLSLGTNKESFACPVVMHLTSLIKS